MSLCHSCVWVRIVTGRFEQRYLRCQSERIPEKYPRQPVLQCVAYERIDDETAGLSPSASD
jgi:hypothetical protein